MWCDITPPYKTNSRSRSPSNPNDFDRYEGPFRLLDLFLDVVQKARFKFFAAKAISKSSQGRYIDRYLGDKAVQQNKQYMLQNKG